ncbi:MAG: SpoIVB peptidase [Clostridiales bacterium]|nr:SpoIVB peptidase [Clostridiales bacterium]
MKQCGEFRRWLIRTFWCGLLFAVGFTWFYMERQVPDHLSIVAEELEELDLSLPLDVTFSCESQEVMLGNGSDIPADEIRLSTGGTLSLYGKAQGSYRLGMKLFGQFLFKEIKVDVVEPQYAIPCGAPVGIYLKSRGIMVIGTGRVTTAEGKEEEPALGVLKSGDYIEAINGEPMTSKEALVTSLNRLSGEEAVLRIRRNGESLETAIHPVETEDGSYKIGAWVRDDTQGIGTMTYMEADGSFGALGHGISDTDTGAVVEIEHGALYETDILGIEKGSAGNPGVMAGVIYYGPGTVLGEVTENTEVGIFGTANERMREDAAAQALPIGYRQDVKKGKAYIRSNVSGRSEDYEIEIQKVELNPLQKNKSMVIRVTDEKLLRLTGGIIQGMSGSPIIQDGRLIGAVTHVFVQDSTRGYGIFVEDMLEHERTDGAASE